MKFTVWYGENITQAHFLVENTIMGQYDVAYEKIYPNDSKDFVRNPDVLKNILYLDKPDLIITSGFPIKPIVSIEITSAAGTGHALFQRIPRAIAAAEKCVPVAYLLPEKVWVQRRNSARWDHYNPLIFKTLLEIGNFHKVPVAAFSWEADLVKGDPSNKMLITDEEPRFVNLPNRDLDELKQFFNYINLTIQYYLENKTHLEMQYEPLIRQRVEKMWGKYHERVSSRNREMRDWSPFTSCREVLTVDFLKVVRDYFADASFGTLLSSRENTIIYKASSMRGDPYAGALAAIDYLHCRNGPTYEDRHVNLVIEFPSSTMNDLFNKTSSFYNTRCPLKWEQLNSVEDAIYLMLHLRDGCRFTKQKEIRTFYYFADGIILKDGVLYRYG